MEAGEWHIIGNSFQALDGVTEGTLDTLLCGATFAEGDRLFLARGDGFYLARYWNTTNNKWSTNPKRFQEDTALYPMTTGVYIHKKTAGDVVFKGKVVSQTIEFGLESGNAWELTALPSPEGKLLSDYIWTGCATGDRLFIARGDGFYTAHYYFQDQGWSTNPKRFVASTTPLKDGQAVYLNKVSAGIGSVQ